MDRCRASVLVPVRVRVGVQLRAPSSPWINTCDEGQKSHSGCSEKYGAMSQLASKAAWADSKVSV